MALALSPHATSPISPSFLHLGQSSPSEQEKEQEELWNTISKRTRSLSSNVDAEQTSNPQQDENARGKRKKVCEEDTKLLDKGLQGVASSLTQLTRTLGTAVEEGICLAETKLSDMFPIHPEDPPSPSAKKRQRVADEALGEEKYDCKPSACEGRLRDHRKLAMTMASKAKFLERELKSLKADLLFMRERCAFLEEENTRLRDGITKGVRPEEDDLVRLQLEALLAEKGRLAQQNANYARENQYLHQLVEYHQLTLQDMTALDDSMPATCLDFSSAFPSPYSSPPIQMEMTKRKKEYEEDTQTPTHKVLQFSSPLQHSDDERGF